MKLLLCTSIFLGFTLETCYSMNQLRNAHALWRRFDKNNQRMQRGLEYTVRDDQDLVRSIAAHVADSKKVLDELITAEVKITIRTEHAENILDALSDVKNKKIIPACSKIVYNDDSVQIFFSLSKPKSKL